jgi:hypothetical protein
MFWPKAVRLKSVFCTTGNRTPILVINERRKNRPRCRARPNPTRVELKLLKLAQHLFTDGIERKGAEQGQCGEEAKARGCSSIVPHRVA